MPSLKGLLNKKDKISKGSTSKQDAQTAPSTEERRPKEPELTIVRCTTDTEEIIEPPSFPDDETTSTTSKRSLEKKERKRHGVGFRKSSNAAITKDPTAAAQQDGVDGDRHRQSLAVRPKSERKISERFHLHRDRSKSAAAETSDNLPVDLPDAPISIATPAEDVDGQSGGNKEVLEQREAQWEKRATILAHSNRLGDERPAQTTGGTRSRSSSISNQGGDENIQEAIRLHEEGDLERSTVMFGRLAQPKGANNALAQVLYGLALRHGWGIGPDPEKAVHYLSLAAANSASIEEQALAAGMKKGGAAKGELVLAIFELGNSFRHGWGVKKDAVAARHYYETAANLGDTDAMEEAAWCYVEGFGGAKDKFKAAQYLRLAEQKGSKAVGNSWIWKEKYNPK
ncbi:hypothetical protein BAUCODRAFT_37263 [Baudoinia panamericana UAMH 10762]|uniref:HCP-like protein n=1 Tax=Baudoinia panamericana (strain UAMH 10762) TaxID=717646 RepID=M2LHF1_BAUPA|nr:uncharacterized protein BAUCODRAFT_37263 [Baudoinia panamericana UAMH 10762]EMC93582.1 hypothetical protein BAUCODRAFT_37263 [Baudoinia panamericana UAMH 10762]